MKAGLIHLYYGDGKGKTTAAVGLAVRAAGTGKRVLFVQFMKGGETGEIKSLQDIGGITVLRSKKKFPFYREMTLEQKQEQTSIHNQLLNTILIGTIQNSEYDMVILDEITYSCRWGLIDCGKLQDFLYLGKGNIEIICTGRNPDAFFLECADYITEMKCIRHPYEKGVTAREGIEY